MHALAQRRATLLPTRLLLAALVAAGLGGLLGALPLPWAALLTVTLAGGLALLRVPELGLCLLAFSVPFGSLYEWSVGGVSIGPSELLLMGTLGAYLLPQVLGGPAQWTLSVHITDQAVFQSNLPFAAAMAVLLLVVSLAMVGLTLLIGRERGAGT